MNCDATSPTGQNPSMPATPATTLPPSSARQSPPVVEVVRLSIPGKIPSWNDILAMEHWARDSLKKQIQSRFLSELQRSASDCSMTTTCVRNTMSIAAATLVSYQATRLEK